jgi:cytochrome P450
MSYPTQFPAYLPSIAALCIVAHVSFLIIYRRYLHPLAEYPGPFLARITSLYSTYHGYRRDIHIDIQACHEKYGDFVRYGPNKLLVNTARGVQDIYGHKNNVKKAQYYSPFHKGLVPSALSAYDKDDHAPRRKILNPSFSETALKQYDATITKHADIFIDKVAENDGSSGSRSMTSNSAWTVERDMAHWCMHSQLGNLKAWPPLLTIHIGDYLGFDIMTSLVFGISRNLMTTPDYRFMVRLIEERMHAIGFFGQSPWLLTLKLDRLLFPGLVKSTRRFRQTAFSLVQASMQTSHERDSSDILKHLIQAKAASGTGGLTQQDLFAEAVIMIVAGSDTTSTTLAAFFFYVSRNPAVYEKVTEEVRKTFSTLDSIRPGPELSGCTYLLACINEALRIAPASPAPLWREVKTGGAVIDHHAIQAGTNVAATIYAMHHNAEYFPEPYSFRPERWIASMDNPKEKIDHARVAFIPFSTGPRGCVGKPLAMKELTLTLARILWTLDFKTVDGEMGKLGEGGPGLGAGRERRDEYQLKSGFAAGKEGPIVQFRRRIFA